ncbi:MAG: molybdate ABC transporter permease subunit [Actinobacteria bacterium]|nr:molybdate ABC transporter permease subunit [Actinomycetota bacterium]
MSSRRTTPIPVGILAAVGVAFLAIPLVGLLLRTPWSRLPELLSSPVALQALRLSLVCSLSATVIAVAIGVPVAWVLARSAVPGTTFVRALVTLPLVLPPVVGGVALLLAFGRRGLIGQFLYDWFGVQLPFSTAGVIMAEAFVAMPFLVITVEGALRSADPRFDEAAATLGASQWTVLRRVTMPLIAPALLAGTVLAWARALGEFGATITFAGNLPGVTQTMPLAVYAALDGDRDAAIALSLVLLIASLAVLLLLRDRYLRSAPS